MVVKISGTVREDLPEGEFKVGEVAIICSGNRAGEAVVFAREHLVYLAGCGGWDYRTTPIRTYRRLRAGETVTITAG